MRNPLGICQLRDTKTGTVCQRDLCVRNGRIECNDGHPQPDHPKTAELAAAAAARAARKPEMPVVAAYTPEPTWAKLARQLAALETVLMRQQARIEALEADSAKTNKPRK
jgi:LmbE family N-acetylglucosaminyl deacetylase